MLVEKRLHEPLRDRTITVMFRRWRRHQVVAGRVYRTAAGLIAVDAVEIVAPSRITSRDARAAGYPSIRAVVEDLRGTDGDQIFLLRVRHVDSADPRDVLAGTDVLDAADVETITARLTRLDRASANGPWTTVTLRLIERRPEVRAGDLAAELGRDTPPFKLDVRKLKALGLTVSLDVGYRISPRGAAYLRAIA